MRPETTVLDIQGQYRVYTEFYRSETAEKTIILVHGSLQTTTSFAQTLRYLYPHFNVVLYDQPYAGLSKPHNHHERPISKEDEALVLLELIDHFAADHVLSFSWGGAATLLALAHRPKRIEKAVINSFTARINTPMREYLNTGLRLLHACDRYSVGSLINNTIGKHLPSLFKRFNYRHISNLDEHEYMQMYFHVREVLEENARDYIASAKVIDIPMLFVNGEWDEYTCPGDARLFAQHARRSQFSTIKKTGHFLDMEHKDAWMDTRQALLDFLLAEQPAMAASPSYAQGSHALVG